MSSTSFSMSNEQSPRVTPATQPHSNAHFALALYVHIPFCQSKCPYCDFNTYAGIETLMPGYVDALAREIEQWGAWLERPTLASVFFGGGTPSYLPTRSLQRLMQTITSAFDLPSDAEATIEANPGDCARERLQAIRGAGFNRISLGVQSFDDAELSMLGRRHSAADAERAVANARQAGFDNLSIDLMFGLPNQYVSTWEHSLERAVALRTNHLSAYALTLEPGTPLEANVRLGATPEPDTDLAAEMYTLGQTMLATAGLGQYEISNWAQQGRESTHNLAYWRSLPYLGVGPGAHSYLHGANDLGPFGVRFANTKPPRTYIERVNAWTASGTLDAEGVRIAAATDYCEPIDRRTAMAETMMMGLRLNDGVDDDAFCARFGEGITQAFPTPTAECLEFGLLEWDDGALRLTESGRLLGNEAFERFIAYVPEER